MSEELFEDIPVASVTVSGGSTIDEQAHEGWRLWGELTGRPDTPTPSREFLRVYRGLLKMHYEHAALLRVVEGAARTPPRPRDPKDLRRVLMALDNWDHEAVALSMLEEGCPIILYPRPERTLRTTITELQRELGTLPTQWTSRDHEAAGILIQELEPKELAQVVEGVALLLGQDVLLPVEVLRNLYIAREGRVAVNAKRVSYGGGRREESALEGVIFEADTAAERRVLRGDAPAEIVAFHQLAPPGYWEAVLQELEQDPSLSCESIYTSLQSKWEWHPNDR